MQCRNFSKGSCSYGARCKFVHDLISCEFFIQQLPVLNARENSNRCLNSIKGNRCVLLTCDQKHNDITPLLFKSNWKCYVPTSFKIVVHGHEITKIQFEIWTLDCQIFYLDSELTTLIPSLDVICRHYPPANDGIKQLINRFQMREVCLNQLYHKLAEALLLPKSLIVFIINEYLSDQPKKVTHCAQQGTFNYALQFKI